MSSARVDGRLAITSGSVLAILDEESRTAVRESAKTLRYAIDAEAPVGKAADGDRHPGRLASSHKQSVTKTAYGNLGRVKRHPDAWYGRIVEKGRKAGVSKRGGRRRKVSAAKANPFVDRAANRVEHEVEQTLERGADRATERIQARLNAGGS